MKISPLRNDTSFITETERGSHNTSSAHYEQRGSSEDDEDHELPDLLDLVRKKSFKNTTSMGTRPTKRIDRYRRAEEASARFDFQPRSLDTLQQEKRPPRQSDALRKLRSEDALRDKLGSRRKQHQEFIEGESWSQAIDLTGD